MQFSLSTHDHFSLHKNQKYPEFVTLIPSVPSGSRLEIKEIRDDERVRTKSKRFSDQKRGSRDLREDAIRIYTLEIRDIIVSVGAQISPTIEISDIANFLRRFKQSEINAFQNLGSIF
jgi:hypothetical protein